MANENLKRERFINVAGKRVQKVLDGLDSLSKCSNHSNYDFNHQDVLKMTRAIKEKLRILEASFTTSTKTSKKTFKF